jgi:REP element-mobilizing transposase RayT
MASTLTKMLVHIIYSTKHRADLIPLDVEADLYAYTGGICRGMQCPLLAMNGTTNHVHLLVSLSKNVPLSDLMLNVKRDSSKWIKERRPSCQDFSWQDGYFGFSIGESGVDGLRRYIASQKEHHARTDFKDEVRAFLRKYGMVCDERYVWE